MNHISGEAFINKEKNIHYLVVFTGNPDGLITKNVFWSFPNIEYDWTLIDTDTNIFDLDRYQEEFANYKSSSNWKYIGFGNFIFKNFKKSVDKPTQF